MKTTKKDECSYSVSNAIRTLAMVRETGLEPVRHTTHAPQTCLSANSSTRAFTTYAIITSAKLFCQAK